MYKYCKMPPNGCAMFSAGFQKHNTKFCKPNIIESTDFNKPLLPALNM